jgi:hypothetical protein
LLIGASASVFGGELGGASVWREGGSVSVSSACARTVPAIKPLNSKIDNASECFCFFTDGSPLFLFQLIANAVANRWNARSRARRPVKVGASMATTRDGLV